MLNPTWGELRLISAPPDPLGASSQRSRGSTAPRSIGADPRIKQYTYVKDTVYRLDVAMKIITSIEFAPGEAIDSVLMGDSESWQVIRLQSGNVLAVKPLIEGAKVTGTITAHGRGPKLVVYKFRRRKNYRRKQGHRQPYTELLIDSITG